MADSQRLTPVVILGRGPRKIETIDWLDSLSQLSERCLELPGWKVRFGLSAALRLLPVVGNALAVLAGAVILVVGLRRYRVPRVVAVRMALTWLLDATVGIVPVLGSLWGVWFKADTRNVRLLGQYAVISNDPPPPAWRHWAAAGVTLLAWLLALAVVVEGAVGLLTLWRRLLQPPGD